jgi:hypothetical protein
VRRRAASLLAVVLMLVPAGTARAAVKPGLEGAQELFRQSRWEEARGHLRSQWASLPEKDRATATFLIGRSYVREAEFYRGVRRLGDEIGLAYLTELAAARANRTVAFLPLFMGLYEVETERDAEAERTLLKAATAALPPEWKTSARLRRGMALHRLGRASEVAAALKDASTEGRFCRLLVSGVADPPTAPPGESRREKLLAAALLFRVSRAAEAEALLAGLSLDLPDAEEKSDPQKILRFHDPLLAVAWERIGWERAVVALKPLAVGGTGTEKSLAAYYVGLSLSYLGVPEESARFVASAASLGPELQPTARLLMASSSWKAHPPAAAELSSLWDSTQAQADTVLVWDELTRRDLVKAEPFASKLEARLRDLPQSSSERPSGALVGRWGLARLRRDKDPEGLVTALSEYQDKSNKNKAEWNDPLLLLALVGANSRDQEYAQALETLFELSKTFPGLRSLQWNMQGIYAARQRAGGEARISQ